MSCFVFAQTPANDTHWQLKWQDNFNSFDGTKWIKGDIGTQGGEFLYLEQNVWVENGNLVIEVNNISANCPNPAPYPNVPCHQCIGGKTYYYQGGWVETTRDYNTQFGYIEARIKVPHQGTKWNLGYAFWTLVDDRSPLPPKTNFAEIDIFEIFDGRNNNPDRLQTNIHKIYPDGNPYYQNHIFSGNYTDWHTYAIEWNTNRIIWYLDGKAIRTFSNHGIVDRIRIILSAGMDKKTSPTLHEHMYVDYVKVYQLKCDKNTVVNEISNFNTYNYAVKKSITMSGATTIPANSNISLRATDFIELKAGFEVQTGRELYLDVTPCDNVATQFNREK